MRDILIAIQKCLDDINTALSPEEPEETAVQEEHAETRNVSKKTRRKEA